MRVPVGVCAVAQCGQNGEVCDAEETPCDFGTEDDFFSLVVQIVTFFFGTTEFLLALCRTKIGVCSKRFEGKETKETCANVREWPGVHAGFRHERRAFVDVVADRSEDTKIDDCKETACDCRLEELVLCPVDPTLKFAFCMAGFAFTLLVLA